MDTWYIDEVSVGHGLWYLRQFSSIIGAYTFSVIYPTKAYGMVSGTAVPATLPSAKYYRPTYN